VRQFPLLALARYGVTRISESGWRTRMQAALADAREYTRRCYAHLEAVDPVFPLRANVNPARWELGHIAWFQEYWCQRHGTAMRPAIPRAPRALAAARRRRALRQLERAARHALVASLARLARHARATSTTRSTRRSRRSHAR
jgi:hypothetical protein